MHYIFADISSCWFQKHEITNWHLATSHERLPRPATVEEPVESVAWGESLWTRHMWRRRGKSFISENFPSKKSDEIHTGNSTTAPLGQAAQIVMMQETLIVISLDSKSVGLRNMKGEQMRPTSAQIFNWMDWTWRECALAWICGTIWTQMQSTPACMATNGLTCPEDSSFLSGETCAGSRLSIH